MDNGTSRIEDTNFCASPGQIDAVLAFLPVFEREDFVPSMVEVRPGQFPYHVFADELSQFVKVVYDNGFMVPFDWPAWQVEAQRYFDQPELIHTADIQVLIKLITLHVRKERFFDGHLPAMVECGHITAILRRLKELREGLDCSQ